MLEDDIIVLGSIAAIALAWCLIVIFVYILIQGV